jgi:hypothetical protein
LCLRRTIWGLANFGQPPTIYISGFRQVSSFGTIDIFKKQKKHLHHAGVLVPPRGSMSEWNTAFEAKVTREPRLLNR